MPGVDRRGASPPLGLAGVIRGEKGLLQARIDVNHVGSSSNGIVVGPAQNTLDLPGLLPCPCAWLPTRESEGPRLPGGVAGFPARRRIATVC